MDRNRTRLLPGKAVDKNRTRLLPGEAVDRNRGLGCYRGRLWTETED